MTAAAAKPDKTTDKPDPAKDRDQLLADLTSWRKNLQAQGLDIIAVLNAAARAAFGVSAQPDPPEAEDGGDTIVGGQGADTIAGGQGADTIGGGQGADSLTSTSATKGKT